MNKAEQGERPEAKQKAEVRQYSEQESELLAKNFAVVFAGRPEVYVGSPYQLNDLPFVLKAPVDSLAPYLLSVTFYDNQGKEALKIVDNKLYVSADWWDVSTVEGELTIREKGEIRLRITSEPPHKVIIDVLKMSFKESTYTWGYGN